MNLRNHQLRAFEACMENQKGIVRMACGTGKTLVEVMLCNQEKISCLIAPRNGLIDQHVKYFKQLKMNYIVINCDNEKKNIKNDEKICIIINNCSLKNLPFVPDIVIVDEAHTYQKSVKDNEFINQAKRKYFFTATPQHMNDEFYGETIFAYDYAEALNEKIVCSFDIVPLWKTKKSVEENLEEKMKKKGSQRCIHYYPYSSIEKSDSTKTVKTEKLQEPIYNIDCKTKSEERLNYFENFSEYGRHLLSCKTISYGIDIRRCDSVYIHKISDSIPDTIQKLSRSTRIDEKNPNKKAHIYIKMSMKEPEYGVITDEIKKEVESSFCYIVSCLKEGLDIDVLNDYAPFKKYVEKKKENVQVLNEKREKKIEEIEHLNIEEESNEEEKEKLIEHLNIIEECIKNEEENIKKTEESNEYKKEQQQKEKKKAFSKFIDDFGLSIAYENDVLKFEMEKRLSYEEKIEELKTDARNGIYHNTKSKELFSDNVCKGKFIGDNSKKFSKELKTELKIQTKEKDLTYEQKIEELKIDARNGIYHNTQSKELFNDGKEKGYFINRNCKDFSEELKTELKVNTQVKLKDLTYEEKIEELKTDARNGIYHNTKSKELFSDGKEKGYFIENHSKKFSEELKTELKIQTKEKDLSYEEKIEELKIDARNGIFHKTTSKELFSDNVCKGKFINRNCKDFSKELKTELKIDLSYEEKIEELKTDARNGIYHNTKSKELFSDGKEKGYFIKTHKKNFSEELKMELKVN